MSPEQDEIIYDLGLLLENMTDIRKEAGYTQKEVAELLGVTQGTIAHWESNKDYPSGQTMIKLQRLLVHLQYQILAKKAPDLDS